MVAPVSGERLILRLNPAMVRECPNARLQSRGPMGKGRRSHPVFRDLDGYSQNLHPADLVALGQKFPAGELRDQSSVGERDLRVIEAVSISLDHRANYTGLRSGKLCQTGKIYPLA